jgi:hypothetical protein
MKLKAVRYTLPCLLGLVVTFSISGQSDLVPKAVRTARYESGPSYHEITEAAFRLTGLSRDDRETVAIRICSTEPTLLAIASTVPAPFIMADRFVNAYGYRPDKVVFLFSGYCLSSKNLTSPAIEIWAVPKGALLPSHVNALNSDQIRLVTFGKISTNRGVCDYRSAVGKMIKDLADNPESVGVVFGYFLERPSTVLRRRLRQVTRVLRRSGLPPDRYLVRANRWDDEVSTYPPDSEPRYPSVFVVEMASARKQN